MIANRENPFIHLASLVKLSHTVFALPFAAAMFLILSKQHHFGLMQSAWLLIALLCARTAAMGFNRIVDRRIDAANPRTQQRELVVGKVSLLMACYLTASATLLFLIAAAALGKHCLIMSPLVLIVLLGYSLTKRFTSMSHVVLGLALAMAPGGVWYAMTAEFAWQPVWLMLAVLFWVMGFDILYSCQDYEFDCKQGLFSIPSRYGMQRSFVIARCVHFICIILLFIFGQQMQLGIAYYLGCCAFALALFSQHMLISPKDLTLIDQAFFVRNGLASLFFLAGAIVDRFY